MPLKLPPRKVQFRMMTSSNPELKKLVANHAELHRHLTPRLRPKSLTRPALWSWGDATLLSIAQKLSALLFRALRPSAQKAMLLAFEDASNRVAGTGDEHIVMQYCLGVCMHIDKRRVTRSGKYYGIFVGYDTDNHVVYETVHRLVCMLFYGYEDSLVDLDNDLPAKDHGLDGDGPVAAIHCDYNLKCSSSCINACHIHWFRNGANIKAHFAIRHKRRGLYRGPQSEKHTNLNYNSPVRELLRHREDVMKEIKMASAFSECDTS